MLSAEEITKKAKSNLAIALIRLPKSRRRDMVSFYAFCRIIDDIADEADRPQSQRHDELDDWKNVILRNSSSEPTPLQKEVLDVIDRHKIDSKYLVEIIEGCRSDIPNKQTFGSWEELEKYSYQVACCVGLASIKIFGCKHPSSETYAIKLGHALQLTNILRDVGHDLKNGNRIYLPHSEMVRFQYSERDLVGRVYDGRFIAMMEYHAQHAEQLYKEAVDALPVEDEDALKASESMRKIYFSLLQKMRKDKFQVFTKHYKISKFKKLWLLLTW